MDVKGCCQGASNTHTGKMKTYTDTSLFFVNIQTIAVEQLDQWTSQHKQHF